MKSSSNPKIEKEKSLDLTATHDERPAHHRIHSHVGRKHHDRVPTTYPKPEEDKAKVSDVSMFEKPSKHKQEMGDDEKYNMTWKECLRYMFCCSKK